MTDKPDDTKADQTTRVLSPAARRALEEAAARRAEQEARERRLAETREVKGRGGKDPVRYADWEVKGIASDF
jgi:hypothetical protein